MRIGYNVTLMKAFAWLSLMLFTAIIAVACASAQSGPAPLRFDGFYRSCEKSTACSCSDSSYYVINQLIFRKDGSVYEVVLRTNRDSGILAERYRRIVAGTDHLCSQGTYRISNDTITAQINTLFFAWGQRWKHFKTNYRGRLVSGNCILDWKAVPPYPSAFRRKLHRSLNRNFEPELRGRLFRFEVFPVVAILDGLK